MVVKNGEFIELVKKSFKANDSSVYFWKMKDEHYSHQSKKLDCNFNLFRTKGKSKAQRRSLDNIEQVNTCFNIKKSNDFIYTNFNYDTSEYLEIKLLEANQPEFGNTQLMFEVIYIDSDNNEYVMREFEYIESFNGTQESRLQYYKKFFDSYCENYSLEKFGIYDSEVLKVAYKELFKNGEIKAGWPNYTINEEVALILFALKNNIDYFKHSRYFNLFNAHDTPKDRDYLKRLKLKNKHKKELEKIFDYVQSGECRLGEVYGYVKCNTAEFIEKIQSEYQDELLKIIKK